MKKMQIDKRAWTIISACELCSIWRKLLYTIISLNVA